MKQRNGATRFTLTRAGLALAFMALCSLHMMAAAQTPIAPPVAKQIPYSVKSAHGDRIDEYYWMRDDDPAAKRAEIIEHLNAENAYTDAVLAPLKPLQDKLVAEMRSRIKEDDSTVPAYDNGYWYWRRFDAGAEYPAIVRQLGDTARVAVGKSWPAAIENSCSVPVPLATNRLSGFSRMSNLQP